MKNPEFSSQQKCKIGKIWQRLIQLIMGEFGTKVPIVFSNKRIRGSNPVIGIFWIIYRCFKGECKKKDCWAVVVA